jgi:hypothetical protein
MNEFDTLVFDQLDAFTPEPDRRPDWQGVLRRARKSRTRRLVVALAATVAVLGSAAVVTAALGGFDAWLSGEPGKPAPSGVQQRFEAANERSFAAFPTSTKLRELIRTNVGGKHYALFGFRSGNSLCLRLDSVALRRSVGPTCAPVSRVLRSPAPLVVVVGNSGFQNQLGRTGATVSFGLVADGVARVDVHAVDGTHRAVLGGNAYLWIQRQPNTGQRVLSLTAVARSGSRVTVPVRNSYGLFGVDAAPERSPRGPTRIQARIPNPTVGWFVRGERRGPSLLGPGTRFVKPDPQSNVAVGLTGQWCLAVIRQGGDSGTSCTSGREFWVRGPLNVILSGEGDEFVRVNGVAADGVARVVVYLAGSEKQRAALRDNLFTTLVAADEFPIRIVAYDERHRVVGVLTWRWNFGATVPAAATRDLREIARVTGPNRAKAIAQVGREVRGYRCWRVEFSTGQSPGGCLPPIGSGPSLWVDLVQPAGRDLFVIGHARWPVERVRFEFANGATVSTRPRAGLFLQAIPRSQLKRERQAAFAVGYTSEGIRLHQRHGFVFRTSR